MNNLDIKGFNSLSENECVSIDGGNPGVVIALIGLLITVDANWEGWTEDFNRGWNSYKY